MSGLLTPLEWDTEFFGFPIARAEVAGATPESLRAIEEEAGDLGTVCAYASLEPAAGHEPYLLQTFGYRLVEVSVDFDRPVAPFVPRPSSSTVRPGTMDDIPLLEEAITRLAPWSRYGADPRFGYAAAERMHRAWIERAVREEGERLLLISEDESGLTGLATNSRTPVPRMDLLAVTKPGTGASWALMGGFFDWAGGGPVTGGWCAVRNLSVLRFLENCGFRLTRSQYLYHRWFDDDARGAT